MHRQLFVTALALVVTVLASGPAVAQEPPRGMEWGVESSTGIVNLPDSVPASLTFRPCITCDYLDLAVDESSRFYVGRDAVSLADLRRYASRGPAGLDVFYDRSSKRVTRVILRTELDPADAPRGGPEPTERKPQ